MKGRIAPQAQSVERSSASTPTPQGRLAPHEMREVQLVLSGSKPLATIERDKQPLQYAVAISLAGTGALTALCLNAQDRDCATGEVVITKPGNRRLIHRYLDLLHTGPGADLHGYHTEMGRLFGYTEADIAEFIRQDIGCKCKKCKGGGILPPTADSVGNNAGG